LTIAELILRVVSLAGVVLVVTGHRFAQRLGTALLVVVAVVGIALAALGSARELAMVTFVLSLDIGAWLSW